MSLRNPFKGLFNAAPRQGRNVTTTAATPPIDPKVLQDAVAAALTPALQQLLPGVVTPLLQEALKPLATELATLKTAAEQKPAAKDDKTADKPITAADVQKMIVDATAGVQQTNQRTAAKQQFVEGKLKDLPPAYQRQLGDDPAKWAAEEQAIRDQYKADFKAGGGTVPDKGGTDAGGKKPGETVDLSKMSPVQLATLGLQSGESKPDATAAAK